MLTAVVASPVSSEQIREQIEERYGKYPFCGSPRQVVRFTSAGRRLVRDQVWFPGQESEERPTARCC